MIERMNGCLAIPHEYLHVFAHRLIGKKCQFHLGNNYVTTMDQLSLGEQIFVLLFPFFVTLLVALVTLALWFLLYINAQYPLDPLFYFQSAPIWHQGLWLTGVLFLLYSGTSVADLLKASHLLFQNLRQQPLHHSNNQ